MKLIDKYDPSLLKATPTYEFNGTEEAFCTELTMFMKSIGAMSIPAPYVGVKHRMFIVNTEPEIHVFYNPRVVDISSEYVMLDEIDILYPGVICKVKRPKSVKVRFANIDGEVFTRKFSGMTARLFQQNFDILNGMRFYDKANFLNRNRTLKQIKLLDRRET